MSDAEPISSVERAPPRRRRGVIAVVILALAGAGVAAGMLATGGSSPRAPALTATARGHLAGLAIKPPETAPPLDLRNYLGNAVNLESDRGKAVLVTFLYVHCPDVCPLITSKLHTAVTRMNAAERRQVQIIAVSVDPRGDTPKTVAAFLADHRMTGRMQYLIGNQHQLGSTWVGWGIASRPDKANPDVVDHTALVYGINARGQIAALYPSNFAPAEIVHDVPSLARA